MKKRLLNKKMNELQVTVITASYTMGRKDIRVVGTGPKFKLSRSLIRHPLYVKHIMDFIKRNNIQFRVPGTQV